MNYSDDLKIVWWGVGACGSGTMDSFLRNNYNFKGYSRNSSDIPEGKEDYTMITNVRNPYTWELSSYFDLSEGNNMTFEEFLEGGGWVLNPSVLSNNSQQHLYADYFIRCEDMYSEIQKIPIFKELPSETKEVLSNPRYQKSRPFITRTILRDYWTKDLVKKFSKRYERMFEITGYDMDSWKTGVHWKGWKPLK